MSDSPAVIDCSTMAQFCCRQDTLFCDVCGIKNLKQLVNTLSDNICRHGAMETLITDGGKYEISNKVTNLLCTLFSSQYESEPYHHDTILQNSPSFLVES